MEKHSQYYLHKQPQLKQFPGWFQVSDALAEKIFAKKKNLFLYVRYFD